MREYHYTWQWDLKSSPEALWPLISDTNRFNRDTGLPPMQLMGVKNGVKQVRFKIPFLKVEWDEEPFDWAYPFHFGVVRRYNRGPLKEMRVDCRLTPLETGGTRLVYQVWVQGKNILGQLAIPVAIGFVSAKRFENAYRLYDEIAAKGSVLNALGNKNHLTSANRSRFQSLNEQLLKQNTDKTTMQYLFKFLELADDLSVQRLRPYAMADVWGVPRRTVLESFLRATRIGILDMYWDLLCPECRSVTDDFRTLKDLHVTSHCPSCNIDFTANFDHNIEIIFRPNPSIRAVDATVEFCVGNPQRQPKIAFNFIVPSGEELPFTTVLEEGRYALVASDVSGSQSILVAKDGLQKVDLTAAPGMTWNYDELKLNTMPRINLINKLPGHQTFKMSRASWSDQAATAADVTSLQVFRDLFSSEVLRSGEQISVGSVTIMFTDLRSSTKMYREIGDASAFGRVREHFETLQRAIAQEGGSVVKTIGDSVMATFRQPSAALQAIMNANAEIKEPLMLKIGIHHGPCLVVNLNDRLDYFGSTVNIAARLPNFSNGSEIIFTETIYNDPGTHAFLSNKAKVNSLVRFNGDLKGFDEPFTLWRMDLRK